MKLWAWDEKNLPSTTHAIRTAVAATASVIIARLVQMPKAYWTAIATLVSCNLRLAESSSLWRMWRCGQNINGLHPIALPNSPLE